MHFFIRHFCSVCSFSLVFLFLLSESRFCYFSLKLSTFQKFVVNDWILLLILNKQHKQLFQQFIIVIFISLFTDILLFLHHIALICTN